MKIILLTAYFFTVFTGLVLAQIPLQNPVNEQRQIGGSSPISNQNTLGNTEQGNNKPKTGIKSTVGAENNNRSNAGANNGSAIPLTTAIERSKEYTNALKQVLNLSDDQSHKMIEINTALIQQIDKLSKSSKNTAEFQLGLQEADHSRVDGYSKILTPKQFKVYTDTPQLSGLTSAAIVKADMVKPEALTESASKIQSAPGNPKNLASPATKNQSSPAGKNQVAPTQVK